MKNKSALLVCVYKNGELFKRRIAHEYYAIEEWLNDNAELWANGNASVICDCYCNGEIFAYNNCNNPILTFQTTNIAML